MEQKLVTRKKLFTNRKLDVDIFIMVNIYIDVKGLAVEAFAFCYQIIVCSKWIVL